MTALSKDQLDAYVAAVYEVEIDGRWIEASALPLADVATPAALISARNPYSQLLPESENAQRHLRLQREIEAGGHRCWPARGRSVDASWIEPGFLVQAPLAQVDIWARYYRQHAVWLAPDAARAASLRVYTAFAGAEPPPQWEGMDVEWVPTAS